MGRFLKAVGMFVLCAAILSIPFFIGGCRGTWDNRSSGGELIEIGTPANPCQPACPKPR